MSCEVIYKSSELLPKKKKYWTNFSSNKELLLNKKTNDIYFRQNYSRYSKIWGQYLFYFKVFFKLIVLLIFHIIRVNCSPNFFWPNIISLNQGYNWYKKKIIKSIMDLKNLRIKLKLTSNFKSTKIIFSYTLSNSILLGGFHISKLLVEGYVSN